MWDFTDTFRVLGIEELRTGLHVVRDSDGQITSSGVATTIWRAIVRPGREIRSVMFVVHFERAEVAAPRAFQNTIRGAYVTRACNVISKIVSDPVTDLLGNGARLPRQKGFLLDGIGYELEFIDSVTKANLKFSNPRSKSRLIELQLGLLSVATEIIEGSDNDAGASAINIWRRYL